MYILTEKDIYIYTKMYILNEKDIYIYSAAARGCLVVVPGSCSPRYGVFVSAARACIRVYIIGARPSHYSHLPQREVVLLLCPVLVLLAMAYLSPQRELVFVCLF